MACATGHRLRAAGLVVLTLAVALALTGCTGTSTETAAPKRAATCPADVGQVAVVRQIDLVALQEGGPNLHRLLRVTRLPSGDLCLDVEIGHADPGSDVISSHVEATQAGRTWRQDSVSDERQALRIDADKRGCLQVGGSMIVQGAGEVPFTYEADGQVGRSCPTTR